MLNLNNPTVIWATIAVVLVLFFLVWLLTRRTSVVPEPPVTPSPPTTEPGELPVVAKDGTLQVGALPEPKPTIDLLDSAAPEVEVVPVEDEVPAEAAAPVMVSPVTELPVDEVIAPVEEPVEVESSPAETLAEPEPIEALAVEETVEPEVEAEEEPEPEPEPEEEPEPEAPKMSIFERFSAKLSRSRNQLGAQLRSIFGGGLDEDAWEELEDSLISADVGVDATMDLVEQLRTNVRDKGITKGDDAMAELKAILLDDLAIGERGMKRRENGTSVWLFTGVNGTGKTTSIGKLTKRLTDEGDHVVLAAADTFRAAAADQLKIWGERSGVRVIAQSEGADPAAVAFDGWKAAEAAKADLLMIDTAGRLQNKTELMAELEKIKRVVERDAGPIDEALLVLDATTGQNGLSQAKAFADAVDLTGVVLTKLDGTAKGGIVIAIQRTLGIPVKWVGLGESIEDLAPFDPEAFINALFSDEPVAGQG